MHCARQKEVSRPIYQVTEAIITVKNALHGIPPPSTQMRWSTIEMQLHISGEYYRIYTALNTPPHDMIRQFYLLSQSQDRTEKSLLLTVMFCSSHTG